MAEEVWRDVVGYEGLYQVSSEGRLRSIPRLVNSKNNSFALKQGKVLDGYVDPKGYTQAHLYRDGRCRTTSLHIVVCEAFHGPKPTDEHQVAHGNGRPSDNAASNLRWATPKENSADRLIHGTDGRGEKAPSGKLTAAQVTEIRRDHGGFYGEGMRLARKFGVTNAQITNIIKNRQWMHMA